MSNILMTALAIAIAPAPIKPPPIGAPAISKPAPTLPYAFRGVRLGITLDEFRAHPVVADQPHNDLQTACSGDRTYSWWGAAYNDSDNIADGLVTCQWFGQTMDGKQEWLFVDLGEGLTLPLFQFIDDGAGVMRLARIKGGANNKYAGAILDALRRGYGPPKSVTEPFQTKSGAMFTSTTWLWSNGQSTIVLSSPCHDLGRYCLSYTEDVLIKRYDANVEKRLAAAAEKL